MTDEGLMNAEVAVMLLNIQRNNEAMGQVVAGVANDQRQELKPILQDIIERQHNALSVLLEAGWWRDKTLSGTDQAETQDFPGRCSGTR